ncbi:MAG: TonB-dependent receptor [Anaerolineae bacterium]|nr:TonB-dependent receptor [Gemmatimonadaceae bacterium]
MTPKWFSEAVRVAAVLASVLAVATAANAQQAVTTGAVRGTVTGPEGAPLGGATVIATNVESGVRRGAQADQEGRYQIPFLEPGNYVFRAQFIGYRPVERPAQRLGIAQVERIDFRLTQAAVELATQEILAEADPLIETTKAGTSTRISTEQIQELPTNGRNFKDLTLLAPGVVEIGNTGSGGGQSIAGGRTGASNILMDGVNNNESFFGGDARGGDRAPFSYSIEAVKEIQVITAAYDVERGNFTGGAVNAVTKSGTNRITGAVFGYLRDDKLGDSWITARDFRGQRPVDFRKQQFGFTLGGPIVKDKAHFFFALDQQVADEPRPVFVRGTDVRTNGINADTLDNLVRIARDLYGYDLSSEIGQFAQETDEAAFFGRVDWQVTDKHKLTLRDNYTDTKLKLDRLFISPTSSEFRSNSGNNEDKSNSFVASLNSVFGSGLTNEFRLQYATEDKPRPSLASGNFAVPLPQVRINNIRSILDDGTGITTALFFGADPILHANNLEQQTTEIINNTRLARGNHTIKLGGNFLKVHVFNQFWNNALGTFTYNSLADFENGAPTSFTRALPYFGQETIATQDFDVYEAVGYLQDEWQVNPKLFLTYGVRYDYAWFPTRPDPNPQFESFFTDLDVTKPPTDNNNFSPRLGFAFDVNGDGSQVLRGGTGLFYGRAPFVLYGNALGATGRTQLSLNCTGATVPQPDFQAYAESYDNLPTQCLGGGAASAGTPAVNVFADDYKQSYAWKSNLAYDRLIIPNWRLTLEGVYSTVRDNQVTQDDNLDPTPRFRIEGNIPVFVDPGTITVSNGAVNRNNSRRNAQFDQVYVYRSLGSTLTYQGIVQINGRHKFADVYAGYTYDHTRDNISISCCTLNGLTRAARVNGDPNNFDDQWGPADFTRKHSFVISPRFHLPYGFEVSSIVRIFSGRPWTPTYAFDINGDGLAQDRAYIPTTDDLDSYLFVGATQADQDLQQEIAENRINSVECTRQNRGRVIDRNECVQPWQQVWDARISKKFNTLRGQSFEVVADFFNVLNGLNRKSGHRSEVAEADQNIFTPSGFDTASNKFRYRSNEQFGQETPASLFITTQFQMQLGLRYNF